MSHITDLYIFKKYKIFIYIDLIKNKISYKILKGVLSVDNSNGGNICMISCPINKGKF